VGSALIRPATVGDIAAIAAIYAPYVCDTIISFELDPPDVQEMGRRFAATATRFPYLAIEERGELLGYAYAGEFNSRSAYRWIVETTVYLKVGTTGRGLGRTLYQTLLDELRTRGFLVATGKIGLPNDPSVRLHEAMGFAPIGIHRQVGYKFDAWHDMGVWQLELAPRPTTPVEPRFGG
jgi:L-amino acid N-acyltransferase YncA